MKPSILALALAAAGCSGEPEPVDTGTTPPVETGDEFAVIRDCSPDVGNICPWAGSGYNGFNGDDVNRLDAYMAFPMSVAFPPPGMAGRPVIADWNNHKLRAVNDNPEDGFETIMGTDFLGDGDPALADRTPAGALGTDVALNHPTQQQYDVDGTLLCDSWHTHKFRSWDPATGMVHVVLGSRPGMHVDADGKPVDFDDAASSTLLNQPKELFIDPNDPDLVYFVDMRNERIRVWDRGLGTVSTIAGEVSADTNGDTFLGSKGYCGEGDALATCFNFPKNANPEPGGAIAVSADSTKMYIADSESHVIRLLDLTTGQISLLSGNPGVSGFKDGAAADALWYYPADFAIDYETNELFVADANNHRVRKIDLDTMEVSTVAGTGEPSCEILDLLIPKNCEGSHLGGDGGPAVDATLYRPFGVDLDNDGNLVISDTYDHRLRIVYR